jgi:hypothetical protein
VEAGFGGHFPIEYESVMTPQSYLELGGGGGLGLPGLLDPGGLFRVRSFRRIRGNLPLECGNGGLKSIQSQTELTRENRFDFLPQARACGERLRLAEILR